jgi:hypothetical protein
MNEHGEIRNPVLAKQLFLFDDLAIGTGWPTDIDSYIELHNKAHIFLEGKYRQAPMPTGQRLALERLVYDLRKGGKPAIALVFEHQGGDENGNVRMSPCFVRMYYSGDKQPRYEDDANWIWIDKRMTVKELLEAYIEGIEERRF